MLNNVVKVLMAANDLTPADIISSSGIPKSSFYKDGGLNIEEISSIFNISDINVAILNRLDDNTYSYKQLLFEALRCYLYNSSISNSKGECHRGKAIKSIRKAEGLNISETSKITGIATSIICQTEKGHIEFSLNNIRKYYKRRENHEVYSIDISGNSQVKRILDTLYKDSTIHLNRKYDK